MGQILHGSATTTEAVRRAIQHSQESLRALAKRHGINQKTVAKWKRRCGLFAGLQPMGEGRLFDVGCRDSAVSKQLQLGV